MGRGCSRAAQDCRAGCAVLRGPKFEKISKYNVYMYTYPFSVPPAILPLLPCRCGRRGRGKKRDATGAKQRNRPIRSLRWRESFLVVCSIEGSALRFSFIYCFNTLYSYTGIYYRYQNQNRRRDERDRSDTPMICPIWTLSL